MNIRVYFILMIISISTFAACKNIKNTTVTGRIDNQKISDKKNSSDYNPSNNKIINEEYLANILAKQANDLVNGNHIDDAINLLKQVHEDTWATECVRGDIAAKQKDWKKASHFYDQASCLLGCLSNAEKSADVENRCKEIIQLSNEAKLIYGMLEISNDTKCKTRGHVVVPSIIPVQFEYNQSTLNSSGIDSVNKLTNLIRAKSDIKAITLIGHTDDRGSDEYNNNLSMKRAETVANYLKQHGIRVPIIHVGKGKSSPPVISDLSKYNQDEIWAIQRRVELKFD